MRVFISGTYADLVEYRKKVFETLAALEISGVTMELFGSHTEDPVTFSQQEVERCDVYVGIIGRRYGFIPKGKKKSVTHLEYEAAKRSGKTILIYLMHKSVRLPEDHMDFGEKRNKLLKFREKLEKDHVCSYFTSPDDLARQVSIDIQKLIPSVPAPPLPPEALPQQPKKGLIDRLTLRRVLGLIFAAVLFVTLLTFGIQRVVALYESKQVRETQSTVQMIDAAINGSDRSITSRTDFSPSGVKRVYLRDGMEIACDVFDESNVPLFRQFFDDEGKLIAKDYFEHVDNQWLKRRVYFDENGREFLRDFFTQSGNLIRKEQYINGQWIERAAAFQSPFPPVFPFAYPYAYR